jgi:multicomponent K+:H+ antiporter subunit D
VVINLVGSALFLFAVGTLYGILGSLSMADLAQRIAELPVADRGPVRAAMLLLLAVFALKAALAPLHLWLPGAYASAGPAAAALFAVMTKVGAYAILRIDALLISPAADAELSRLVHGLLLVLGPVTIIAGTLGALASRRLALLAAHLVVVSSGTLLTALGLGSIEGMAAGLYYLLHSTLVAAALFLLTDKLIQTRGDFGDRLQAGPALPAANLLGGLFLLLAIASAGLPPLSGFIGKVLILDAAAASPWMPWLFSVVLVTSLLNLIALSRAGSALFFNPSPSGGAATLPEPAYLVPVIALTGSAALLVILAGPVYDLTQQTAGQLADPAIYIDRVMQQASSTTTTGSGSH